MQRNALEITGRAAAAEVSLADVGDAVFDQYHALDVVLLGDDDRSG